ncbi:MAG TPA: HipA family kinase [Gemmatimonadaceae bacterium]|nr:HipA family kinase [Gemmatimonadaceae bacterium]
MRTLHARRVLGADKRGSSWPVLVETEEPGERQFTKLRGAAQGTGPLVAEVIVAVLAESLGLRVPRRALVELPLGVESLDENDELADLLRASAGLNLGFVYVDDATSLASATELERVGDEEAVAILWLDGLVANQDRTARNPNLLRHGETLWLIDHGASLGFQYALPDIDAAAVARQPYVLRESHLLQSRAPQLVQWDARFAARVTRAVVEQAVAEVPDEFLAPLVVAPGAGTLATRRMAYVAYLMSRLDPPRPFLTPVAAPPNEQRRRGRPTWVTRPR